LNLKELKIHFISELSGLYPSEEVQSFFTILSEYILKYSRLDTVLKSAEIISEEKQKRFQEAILRLKEQEPIQYIIGETEFYSLPFKLNSHTLIPRPETEELVAWVIDYCQTQTLTNRSFEILDIGTGSGCIAISLAKNLVDAAITALDFSSEALQMAEKNAALNGVSLDTQKVDILKAAKLPKSYDVIVSNPPYVRELEKKMMQSNVLLFEPESALFVSDTDPLLFYRKIGQLANQYLKPGGHLFFEINEYLSKDLMGLLETIGFSEIIVRKDIFGKDRMMRCKVSKEPDVN
jgi:release factor glutamine methyltransferase